jgi:hypothetical protein
VSQPETKPKEAPGIILADEVIIPTETAAWFDMEAIHELEKDSLPEFFTETYPSKNEKVYREFRDFMILLYRRNPSNYLSATTCRKYLRGDVGSIFRVHSFLEKHGLINFNIDPYNKPHKISIIKESSYDKVIINAANRYYLCKSFLLFYTHIKI